MRTFVTYLILFSAIPAAGYAVWLWVTGSGGGWTFALLAVGAAWWAVARERKDRLRVLTPAQRRRKYWEG